MVTHLWGGVALSFLGVSSKLIVPFGHRNKGTAARGNGGIRSKTGSTTRAQRRGDQGGRGPNIRDPILSVYATCRRYIVLIRQSV